MEHYALFKHQGIYRENALGFVSWLMRKYPDFVCIFVHTDLHVLLNMV